MRKQREKLKRIKEHKKWVRSKQFPKPESRKKSAYTIEQLLTANGIKFIAPKLETQTQKTENAQILIEEEK